MHCIFKISTTADYSMAEVAEEEIHASGQEVSISLQKRKKKNELQNLT